MIKPFDPSKREPKRSFWRNGITLSLVAVVVLVALIKVMTSLRVAAPDDLMVYCAAGLRKPVMEAAIDFENEFNVDVKFNFASSGGMEAKLELDADRGKAYADLFIPADLFFAKRAREKGFTAESVSLASFRLVVASNPDANLEINSLDDIIEKKIPFAICDPEAAAGKTTMQALQIVDKWNNFFQAKKASFPTVVETAAVVKTSDVQTGEDVYFYFQEDDSQPVLLGISGSDLQPGFTDIMSAVVQDAGTQQFSDFYPLTFGKSFAPISVPIDVESLGLSMTGAYDMTGEVDAWGQVSVPAGTFDALRVFVHGESVLTLEAESEEPTVLTQTVDQWSWMAPRVGQCVVIQQITTRFSEIEEEVEPFTLTQVLRLSDFRSDITAVEAATWGALKAAMSR